MTDAPTRRPREDTFTVELNHLVRTAVPARGKPYEHRCSRDSFREVLWAGEELASGGFTVEEIVAHTNLPSTQVAVALAFLKERGCIETHLRRNYPASRALYEDAMVEFCILAENDPDEYRRTSASYFTPAPLAAGVFSGWIV